MGKFLLYGLMLLLCGCSRQRLGLDSTRIESQTSLRLNTVRFIQGGIGFAAGGAQYTQPLLLKTTDGGSHWAPVKLPGQNEQKEIYGLDLLPDGQMVTVGYGGTIYTSKDSGQHFQYVQHSSWKALRDVAFRHAQEAIIAGGIGFREGYLSFFRADGSGTNTIQEYRNFELTDIDMIDSMTGYCAGYGAILKTTDGGQHWAFTAAKNDFFKAMAWKNAMEGVAVGYEGSIVRTTDGGANWSVIRNGNDLTKKKIHFLDIARNDAATLLAVGEKGTVFASTDDGEHWTEAASFTGDDLRGVSFRDRFTAFAVGDNGALFRIVF